MYYIIYETLIIYCVYCIQLDKLGSNVVGTELSKYITIVSAYRPMQRYLLIDFLIIVIITIIIHYHYYYEYYYPYYNC